jgi:class 3 adenylate cyclase/cytochrome c-type biogenesis protein CcmH/NrfF
MLKKSKKVEKNQRALLPILLWLVPLIAINIGFYFLASIELHWQQAEQKELANQEIESLALSANFSYQFARKAEDFRKSFQSLLGTEMSAASFKKNLRKRAEKIFRWPFPERELFVFKLADNDKSARMLMQVTDQGFSKTAFSRTFKHLVDISRNEEQSYAKFQQNEKLLKQLLGGAANSENLAISHRGKTSYAIFRRHPHFFIWDYFTIQGDAIYGYMLLSPVTDNNRADGMLLSLRDFRDQRIGLAAFLPLFEVYDKAVIQAPLHKSKLFRNWARNQVPSAAKDLKQWLASGTPPVAELGNFKLFSYLGKGNTHLTTLLLPRIKMAPVPMWLSLLNYLLGSFILLLLIRGFLLERWLQLRLRIKFLLTFLLAATLPLSLLVIVSSGYLSQFRRSIHFQTVSDLLLSLKQFDSRKARITDNYRNAFLRLVKNPALAKALKEEGAHSNKAKEIIEKTFENSKVSLPLSAYAIFDESADGIRGYGVNHKKSVDVFLNSFSYPIVEQLRRLIQKKNPEYKLKDYFPDDEDRLSVKAYNSITSLDLVEETGKRRSTILTRIRGSHIASQLHDYVKVDGAEKFAIIAAWEDNALDNKTIAQTTNYLALNQRNFSFLTFDITPQGLRQFSKPGRHISVDARNSAEKLAEHVYFKGSYASMRSENFSIVAYPSKNYSDKIFVGIAQNFAAGQKVFYRLLVLGIIIVFAVVLVLFCALMVTRIVLRPIMSMQSALNKVAQGNLDAEIPKFGNDDLGILASEFSEMSAGLRERRRLASLLSDHAIEALSKEESFDGILAAETFTGVALVSDIRNFTGMCETYSPDQVTKLLNEHFARMSSIIAEHGGRIYKFVGDAIEAVFPEVENEDSSPGEKAFQAASAMIIEITRINQERKSLGLYTYQAGVGLAYGRFFSGGVGSIDTRLDYAVVGEPFKHAADLEALSKTNPTFPIVVDNYVREIALVSGIDFESVPEQDNAFVVSGIANLNLAKEEQVSLQKSSSPQEVNPQKVEENLYTETKIPLWLVRWSMTFLIIVLGAAAWWSFNFKQQTLYDSNLRNRREETVRLSDQLKVESAAKIGFETYCTDLTKRVQSTTSFKKVSGQSEALKQKLEDECQHAKRIGLNFKRFAAFEFTGSTNNLQVETAFNKGWNARQKATLSKFARYQFLAEMGIPSNQLYAELRRELPDLLGSKIQFLTYKSEGFATAQEVEIDGQTEHLFTRFLVAIDPKLYAQDLSNNIQLLRSKVSKDSFRIVGMIALSISEEDIHSPALLVNAYAGADTHVAIADRNGSVVSSANFPKRLSVSIASGSLEAQDVAGVLVDDELSLQGVPHKLYIVSLLKKDWLAQTLGGLLIIGLIVLALIFLQRVLQQRSLLNRSLSAKLWFAFFVCSLLPIATVYFVVELYNIESLNARISQEKVDLQRFLETFEQRQTFPEPLAWKYAKEYTFSKELRQAIETIDAQPAARKDFSNLNRLFNSWHSEFAKLRHQVSNFSIKSVALCSKGGWKYFNSGSVRNDLHKAPEPDQFGILLSQITQNLLHRFRQEIPIDEFSGQALVGEEKLRIGIRTVEVMFGKGIGNKLRNAIGRPVRMSMVDAVSGLIIYPVEQLLEPDYVLLWMILFENGGYLDRIARMFRGNYAVFPVEFMFYARISSPTVNPYDLDLTKIIAWVSTSNLPMVGITSLGNHDFLFSSYRGLEQNTMVLTGFRALNPIINSVGESGIILLSALLLAALLIALLAKNVGDEIVAPVGALTDGMKEVAGGNFTYRIVSYRTDELGDLCKSFNNMTRGLEEKLVMGKMLSRSAQQATSAELTTHKEEAVIVYIGSPGFSSWLAMSKPAELFADLQKQIAQISQILIDEGGEVDKVMGEKVLAVFRGDSLDVLAMRACRVAQGLLKAEQTGLLPFPIAVGINSGTVIAGLLGVGSKKDFTVIGDAVNVSARIEALAETMRYFRVLLSENIYESLNRDINAKEYGMVNLKGKTEQLKVYQLDLQ